MAQKNFTALALGGALIGGVAIGAAIGSRTSHEIAAVAERVEAIETGVAERVGAIGGEVEAMIAAAAPSDAMAALEARVEELTAQAAAAAEAPAAVEAVQMRVATLADQMAALIGRMEGMAAAPAPAESPAPAAEAPASEAAAPAPAAPAAAAPAATPGGDDAASRLAAQLSENGAALSPGRTATIGGAAVFLSRIDAETGDARVLVVGQGPGLVGPSAGPLGLPGGCTLSLLGVAGGQAFLDAACPN